MSEQSPIEAAEVRTEAMLNGELSQEDILTIFRQMEETGIAAADIMGGLRAMRKRTSPITVPEDAIETCGSGGSGLVTFNTSTFNAFLLAAAGLKVAKSGNRSASGNSGSMDVVEALGAKVDLTPQQEIAIFKKVGLVFKFPKSRNPLHAESPLAVARRAYGKLTIFNLLGCLANSVGTKKRMTGIAKEAYAPVVREVASQEGTEGKIVTGLDGLDEVTVCAPTRIWDIASGEESLFKPQMLDIPTSDAGDIEGGTPQENARTMRELSYGRTCGPLVNLVLVNAAHAIQICRPELSLRQAYEIAKQTLESGSVHSKIMEYVKSSHET